MSYRLIIMPSAEREMRKFEHPILKRLIRKIHTLSENPRPYGIVKLKNVDAYRLRVGDWRILYSVNDSIQCVYVLSVGHRRDVYR